MQRLYFVKLIRNLKGLQEYQKAEDVTPRYTPMHQYKTGISGSELLTNKFLVVDPVSVDFVLEKGDNW
jgi:hypothetical protein